MSQRVRHSDIRPYLPHAIAATLWVVGLPIIVLSLSLYLSNPDPAALSIVAFGICVSIGAGLIGSAIWNRRPASADIAFGELMIWSWLRRRHLEDQLHEGTQLLGLDRSGTPRDEPKVTRAQQLEVLRDLTSALEAKDPYTHGHSQRVERHVYRTALALGMAEHDIEDLRKAAALHDVGKVRVPDRLLRNPDQLTIEDRALMEEHVLVGAWMVSRVGSADVVQAVRHHHERWDGAGYPDGLSGTEIPVFARIIAVADSFDAMTSTRPYRAALERRSAVDEIKEGAGSQFDPMIVEAFLSTLPSPVPVAGIFLLLLTPERVVRNAAVWAKRIGAGSLAPAAGAAGAAVFIGAAAISPSMPAQAGPAPQAQTQVTPTYTPDVDFEDADEVLGSRQHRDRPNRSSGSKSLSSRGYAVGQIEDDAAPEATPEAPPEGDPSGQGDPPPEESTSGFIPPGDPRPDKGKDCDQPQASKGHTRHCG